MTVVAFDQWPEYLARLQSSREKAPPPPVVLIHGEELLGRQVLEDLLPLLIQGGKQAAGYQPVDGDAVVWSDVLAEVNTYALLGDARLVAVLDAKLFHSAKDAGGMVKKIENALGEDNSRKAARHFVTLLGLLGIGFEELGDKEATLPKALAPDPEHRPAWLDLLLGYCREEGLSVPESADAAGLIETALAKGFVAGNCLLITTDVVDKRRTLYNSLDAAGLIVDCSVPSGERMADRKLQQAVMRQQMRLTLGKSGKTLTPGTFQLLQEMTGFELRTFTQALEKLIAYAGSRDSITPADVRQVLIRTKKDPIFEFTNAVSEKDLGQAMFFLDSLLASEFHPLQLLAALANQLRRLLVMKDFAQSQWGQGVSPQLSFAQFKAAALPAMAAFDDHHQALSDQFAKELAQPAEDDAQKPRKRSAPKPKAPPAELRLAARPASAYPLYLTFKKQARFTAGELCAGMLALSETDLLLKTGNRQPRLVMERLLMKICLQ
ncbi:MAG: hypothetical protein WBG37_15665 [Desulfobacterales bacterium]